MSRTRESGIEPRRILALDGGGIRGILSLGILEGVERMLREQRGDPDRVLADDFDLIAGTSTGAIIAACLAWGMPVDEVVDLYLRQGEKMFRRAPPWMQIRARYRAGAIAEMFRQSFEESDGSPATFGSPRIRTLLLVVMRNATTGSPWPLCNNPDAMFNDPTIPDCNLNIPLWKLLRASTAAPMFFPPEEITLGASTFTFIDGGVTPYNNPALIALLTATLPEYRIGWATGVNRIRLVSVGTGAARARLAKKPVGRLNLIDHMRYTPPALIGSVNEQQDMLCRILGRCEHGDRLDLEVGDLRGPGVLSSEEQICTYVRFNPPLEEKIRLDDVRQARRLLEIGRRAAPTTLTGIL